MKRKLLDWLCCPDCSREFALRGVEDSTGEIIRGTLTCTSCGEYPIINGIPRILAGVRRQAGPAAMADASTPFERVQTRTRRSFGFQWTTFSSMYAAFEQNFLNYVSPLAPEDFRGRVVLDAGCGFGRHLYYAATYGAEVVGVDFSAAIESTQRNTCHLPGVHLVQCDLYQLPFRPGVFDLVYSIGVLHHLPDPEAGFRGLLKLVKPDGAMAIWVYSTSRRGINACLEACRALTTRLPLPLLHALSWAAGLVDWVGFILPYRLLHRWAAIRPWLERTAWSRIKLYACYPLEVCVADWFDRLAAPIRFYYGPDDLRGWSQRAMLTHVEISPTGLYGWRMFGQRSPQSSLSEVSSVG